MKGSLWIFVSGRTKHHRLPFMNAQGKKPALFELLLFRRGVVAAGKLVGVIYAFVVFLYRGKSTRMRVQHPILPQFPEAGDRPWFGVVDRIVEGENDFQGIRVHALPAFGLVHGLADRKALPGEESFAVVEG